MATNPMTDSQKVEYVMSRLEVDAFWVWKHAFEFSQIYEPDWYIRVKVREYQNFDIIPECVVTLVDRMIEDRQALFFRKEVD